jgi:hypothetical protein
MVKLSFCNGIVGGCGYNGKGVMRRLPPNPFTPHAIVQGVHSVFFFPLRVFVVDRTEWFSSLMGNVERERPGSRLCAVACVGAWSFPQGSNCPWSSGLEVQFS